MSKLPLLVYSKYEKSLDNVIGIFFIDGNWNGNNYLAMFQNNFCTFIFNSVNPQVLVKSIWFQQDGTLPHYLIKARQYLELLFLNQLIGRLAAIEWPA